MTKNPKPKKKFFGEFFFKKLFLNDFEAKKIFWIFGKKIFCAELK